MAVSDISRASNGRTTSQTLARGLDIIEAVSQDSAANIGAIAERTGMTYSTTHRIVSVLVQRRYIKRVPRKGYCLGSKILHLGFAAYSQVDLSAIARPHIEWLAEQTSDAVHLACNEMDEVLYLDKIDSRRPIAISSHIGGLKPMISTGLGKALLMDEPVEVWQTLYDENAAALGVKVARDDWLEQMKSYVEAGYCFDLGEDEATIYCVAAPIRDANKCIVAAVSVSSTIFNMPRERMREIAPLVTDVAREISSNLGY